MPTRNFFLFLGSPYWWGALSILLLGWIFSPETLPQFDFCPFRRWTGWPCAGCGLTRSFCCIGHLEFRRAWDYHPFGFLFYLTALVMVSFSLLRLLFPSLAIPSIRRLTKKWLFFGLAGSLFLFGLWRIVGWGG